MLQTYNRKFAESFEITYILNWNFIQFMLNIYQINP